MNTYSIASIPADGIGKEVVPAALEVLETLQQRDGGFTLNVESFPWSSDYYKAHGIMMPEDGLETLKKFDAILFGPSARRTCRTTSRSGACA